MNAYLLLAGAGLVAGAMNAMAGGGSFVSLPAMIAVGVPSVAANASSTVALLPGSLASVWAYRAGLGPVGGVPLRSLLVVTVGGGALGGALLLSTPTTAFTSALPWLLLVATATLFGGRRLGALARARWSFRPATVLVVQFALGLYGGYFGGAVGIMMLAVWGLLDPRDLQALSSARTTLVSAANAIAVLIFVAAKTVWWRETFILLAGATLGGYLGALASRSAPPRVIRAGTLILAACVTAAFFKRAYWP